jgi:hypothetical protein
MQCRFPSLLVLFVCCVGLSGSAPAREPSTSAGRWNTGESWTFHASDRKNQRLGDFTVSLTGQPGAACIAGPWKHTRLQQSALALLDLEGLYANGAQYPVYTTSGAQLTLLLNPNACDDYLILQGNLRSRAIKGEIRTVTIGSYRRIGEFVAKPGG